MEATVFNIQKFSLDDGPGIRTTVFLKGCPLRCAWCANPESQLAKPQLEWDPGLCVRCGACARASRFVELSDGRVRVDHDGLEDPESVAAVCPVGALSVAGEAKDADEVVRVCLQDRPFYEESGGGVTFSGGEPCLWPEFIVACARRLHEEGVPVAVETCGQVAPERFAQVLDAVDLVLFDMKHWDGERHREGTGADFGRIRENLRAAAAAPGVDVLVRVPVIPGFNDGPDAPDGFAGRLREAGLCRVQLLPFHQLGEGKYERLGRGYRMRDVRPLHPEDLSWLMEALRERGIDAFVA